MKNTRDQMWNCRGATAVLTVTLLLAACGGQHAGDGNLGMKPLGEPDLVWIRIPAGTFEMGCSPGDTDCTDVEKPRHTVTVTAFDMLETEVTTDQFVEFLNAHGNKCDGNICVKQDAAELRLVSEDGSWAVEVGYERHPQAWVSWHGAAAFCEWVGGRLPSEAEWEYAARGGVVSRYTCGNDPVCLDDVAWFFDNADGETHPVANKVPSAFGLYDVHGNVWEWVADCWHSDYDGAPIDNSVWTEEECLFVGLRGGSWDEDGGTPPALRLSRRGAYFPELPDDDGGFRCARQ